VEKKVIDDILQLRSQKAKLRDLYMARASLKRLSERGNGEAVLLCADSHFSGVKHHLENAGVCVTADTIESYEWYISNDQIDSVHQSDH
jgi:hypothetical protein